MQLDVCERVDRLSLALPSATAWNPKREAVLLTGALIPYPKTACTAAVAWASIPRVTWA
jgi:hypothetical protein